MINLLKKITSSLELEARKIKVRKNNKIIEEIHHTFYTEVDRLLAEANIKVQSDISEEEDLLIKKGIRLKALGFESAKDVGLSQKVSEEVKAKRTENERKDELLDAIHYFSYKYPMYKFITEDSVKKICGKYNLIYGDVKNYKGEIPEKNLNDIEKFKISEDDECFVEEDYMFNSYTGRQTLSKEFKSVTDWRKENSTVHRFSGFGSNFRTIKMKCPLEIAAPLKDFNMEGMEVKNFKISKIEVPDPIVLKPVVFKRQKYYLIVTAWGIEATDELVVNARHN